MAGISDHLGILLIDMNMTPSSADKRNVIILITAQAVLGAQMPALFVVGGLAGQMLAQNICFATLPISIIVFGSMTTAPWLSRFMIRFGRRAGFILGAIAGPIGAPLGAYAIWNGSFVLLWLARLLSGVFMSSQGFYRFAASDMTTGEFRTKAIYYVMAGGLVSAIAGPQIVKLSSDAMVIPFVGLYLAVGAINIVGMLILSLLRIPSPHAQKITSQGRSLLELLQSPRIFVSILCAMVTYALMNLVMTATPLAVVGCGYTQNNAADIVMLHVIGMFAPSFFTGHLINRFGVERIIGIGLAILGLAGLTHLAGITLTNFFVGLLFLGIGWNFGFIGATTMLANAHNVAERGRVQGMNDFAVFGFVTLASLASGGLLNCSGTDVIAGWNLVNYAMVPFLGLAGAALYWLSKLYQETV